MAAANASLGDLRTWTHHVFYSALSSRLCKCRRLGDLRAADCLDRVWRDMAVAYSNCLSSICPKGLMKMTNFSQDTLSPDPNLRNFYHRNTFTASPTHQLLQYRQREEGLRKTLKEQLWQPLRKSPVTNMWQIFALGLTKWSLQERWSPRIDRPVQHLLSLSGPFTKLRKATTSFV